MILPRIREVGDSSHAFVWSREDGVGSGVLVESCKRFENEHDIKDTPFLQ